RRGHVSARALRARWHPRRDDRRPQPRSTRTGRDQISPACLRRRRRTGRGREARSAVWSRNEGAAMKEPLMTEARAGARTRASRIVKARPGEVYAAFMDPDVLVTWLPPARMTGKIHAFDPRVGGGYRMSLYHPPDERSFRGKTSDREDMVNVRFVELAPPRRIVEAVSFVTTDPAFLGEMTIVITI